jgi:hypothetical protein
MFAAFLQNYSVSTSLMWIALASFRQLVARKKVYAFLAITPQWPELPVGMTRHDPFWIGFLEAARPGALAIRTVGFIQSLCPVFEPMRQIPASSCSLRRLSWPALRAFAGLLSARHANREIEL